MKITALISFRNEESYLGNCLRYLISNGMTIAAIDNDSTDDSRLILREPDIRDHIVAFETVPYDGCFRWKPLLEKKMQIVERLDADWLVHVDADEIMHSYRANESLAAAIRRISQTGCTIINMDEFVFLPVEQNYACEAPGVQQIAHYYFFEPQPKRLMRAWKNAPGVSMVESGGHAIVGGDGAVAAESLALRHYLFRNQTHAYEKYTTRRYCPRELARGWHWNRINNPPDAFRFPAASLLKRLEHPESWTLDKSHPQHRHYWQW